jgi:hypothetical protein
VEAAAVASVDSLVAEVSHAIMRTGIEDVDAVDRSTIAEVDTVDWSTAAGLSEGRAPEHVIDRSLAPAGIRELAAAPQIDAARALCDVRSVARSIISAVSPSHASLGNVCVPHHAAEGTRIVTHREQYRGRIVRTEFKLSSVDCDLRDRRRTLKDPGSSDDDEVAREDAEQDMIVADKHEQCESRIQLRRRSRYSVWADSRETRH